MFVDRVTIEIAAGRGGDGCLSFRREKYIPRGGPDGGDGGDGGSVVLVAEPDVNNLAALAHRKQWRAERGEHGRGSNCHGRSAEDLIIRVPPGTVITDAEHGHVLKDLSAEGERVIAGGCKGQGNTWFKSATNQRRASTPRRRGRVRELRWS
jgi:GTP-binding protein